MNEHILKISPLQLNNRQTIQTWFYNPIIAFLAFPSKSEGQFDAYFEQFLNEETCMEIYSEDKLVGCIIIEFKMSMRIRSIFIDQKFRGNKYARIALETLIERFPGTEFDTYIHHHQREHIQLFERCGFSKTEKLIEFEFEGKKQKLIKYKY
jgi:GNAT superfamily N-acetyltransferase